MRSSTSVNQASGSTSFSFAVWISDATMAQWRPPLSAPGNRAFFRLCLDSHNRKNALFAGSDEGGENWAAVASLIETCKLNGVDPQRYLTQLLTRLVNGWPQARIDALMPWNCAAEADA